MYTLYDKLINLRIKEHGRVTVKESETLPGANRNTIEDLLKKLVESEINCTNPALYLYFHNNYRY